MKRHRAHAQVSDVDALVTMQFRVKNVGGLADAIAGGFRTWEDMVIWLVKEEGIIGVADDAGEIVKVQMVMAFSTKVVVA